VCARYAWYNVLMYFAVSRADRLGLTKAIRKAEWKVCPLCNRRFVEDSLPAWAIDRLGIDHLDFCEPCLELALFDNRADANSSRDEVLAYLQDLTAVLERIPSQGFGESRMDLYGLNCQERLAILQVLKRKPSMGRVKELFGSWLEALIEAGVLEGGTRRASRGTQCMAKDGHVCFSLAEKTIDDFLHAHGIPHDKEPPYPEGGFRADFATRGMLIEYFGLAGDPEYDEKTRRKQSICRKHGIRLISVYPKDLVSINGLKAKLLDQGLQESPWQEHNPADAASPAHTV
jgi:hypothetical protein